MGVTHEKPRLQVLDVNLSQFGIEGALEAGIMPL
jgi:hypothetical protein